MPSYLGCLVITYGSGTSALFVATGIRAFNSTALREAVKRIVLIVLIGLTGCFLPQTSNRIVINNFGSIVQQKLDYIWLRGKTSRN